MKLSIISNIMQALLLMFSSVIISCSSNSATDDSTPDDTVQVEEEEEIEEPPVNQDPPFSGTVFLDPDIIIDTDPTTFESMVYSGQGMRTMYDRRANDWVDENAFLFDVTYSDGLALEIQVNPEFSTKELAEVEADKYARVLGRLPKALRVYAQTVWIHKGDKAFGGGNNNFLIHTEQGTRYENDGILEEVFVHEGSHTSLDSYHAKSSGWIVAQEADGNFISTYARDNSEREDVAESFLPYLAVKYRSDRISEELKNTINITIPNRIAYFEGLALDMSLVK